ncbi:hypothetical protein [Mucilaginibacter sp. AK015]|uniref:hypothetical protein n=1 Tax=Mucilaginibacter sp. AK015 TaxID=2723072 RepID=UPI001607CB03|nr:hypothetical protein [Mucilaginibacter sp. AK015]MBB5397193.1 hypothetical protein [Mucilaginibacter sp. AK015]
MHPIKTYMYTPVEIQLAHEIAEQLHDHGALSLYLTYAKQYPHEKLRELLEKVNSVPDREIKRTRGALFTFLVGQYHKYGDGHSRN